MYLEKVSIIPNIVCTKFLDDLSENDKKQISAIREKFNNKKLVFFIGVHREYKGLQYLVDAAKYLTTDYVVLIAGKGPLTDELKQKVLELSLKNVFFIGSISEEEKKQYLWASDVYAFPSITKNEAFGIALAEALYCELPAVTFTIKGSGVNWVNQDCVTGLEVKEYSPEKYAMALMSVSKEQYSKNAREWVEKKFTENAINDKVKDFFS